MSNALPKFSKVVVIGGGTQEKLGAYFKKNKLNLNLILYVLVQQFPF